MMLSDEEIKALAHKASEGETGRREFSADVAWLLAFARSVEAAERERWAAVCDANASAKRALYAKTESDDDLGAAEMAEWLATCIRGA